MKILEFDSVGGASGDMIMAALIDLGVSRDELQKRLNSLAVEPFVIDAVSGVFNGFRGTQVRVRIQHDHDHEHEDVQHHNHVTVHNHNHNHNHEHDHEHGHDRKHGGTASAAHAPHRGLKEIREIITAADLPAGARDLSLDVFERLAAAEAHVHGVDPESIHFHEVGAVDSIVDITGACLARELLGVTEVTVNALPLGCGTIKCDHGILPSPAPATVELLRDLPTLPTDEPFELVTPTGAALLAAWRTMPLAPESAILRAGYGFGHACLRGRPNMLRAVLRETGAAAVSPPENCLVLECNLDDMTPELTGALTEKLRASDVLDVFVTPVQMKKQRPGILITVLCRPEQRAAVLDILFVESSTFGVREQNVGRVTLERRFETVRTSWGDVRVKVGSRNGCDLKRMPEYDDCAALAQRAGVPVASVYAAAQCAALVP